MKDSSSTKAAVQDALGRPIRDLRISITDRCNFRCPYCMPREVFGSGFHFLERKEILTFEEISRTARVFAGLGLHKIRLTGGEPLLRRDIARLIGMLGEIPGLDMALTTNGVLLPELAPELKAAGLGRVTVSLDALDPEIFRQMGDTEIGPESVLRGIEAACAAGLRPLKINAVIKRGMNESEILPLAKFFKGSGHILRFIEYMDVGATNGWRMEEVVTAQEIMAEIHSELPIERVPPTYMGEVAERWRYLDGDGEIGIVASVTRPFCGNCTRVRLSAEGKLYTCLFATDGHDLRQQLRGGSGDESLARFIAGIWRGRSDRYSELRRAATASSEDSALAETGTRIEMSYIGG